MNEALYSSATCEWETPKDFFDRLDAEFHFTLDVCATAENAKCKRFYTKDQDGLRQDWTGETVWCNPPYGREMPRWIEKCAMHAYGGGYRGDADPGADGHAGVSQMDLPAGRDPVYQRPAEIRGQQEQRALPVHGGDLRGKMISRRCVA